MTLKNMFTVSQLWHNTLIIFEGGKCPLWSGL